MDDRLHKRIAAAQEELGQLSIRIREREAHLAHLEAKILEMKQQDQALQDRIIALVNRRKGL